MKLRLRTPHKNIHKSTPKTPPKPTPEPKFVHRRRRRYCTHQRRFICALCRSRFTRRRTVYDHFPLCVRKNGNPRNVRWNEDVSCWVQGRQSKREDKPSSRLESLESEVSVPSEVETDEVMGDEEEGEEAEVEGEGVEMPSSPPRRLISAEAFRMVAEWAPEKVSGAVAAGKEDEGGEKRLHPFTVMRIASLVILASKEHASRGVEEVKAAFALWADLDPLVRRPVTESDEEMTHNASARRITIGMFANRVFSSCLTEADGRHDGLLALTSGLRDVAAELGAADTVAKIHDLVSLALGDEGPLML